MKSSRRSGWVRIHRKIEDNFLYFSEPFTKAQAWIDLFLNANHAPGKAHIRGCFVPVKRGQIAWSEVTMTMRWKWSKNKVRRFLKLLETEQQITQEKSSLTSLITIINYDKHQQDDTADDTAEGQQTIPRRDSRRYTNNNEKNEKNDKKQNLQKTFEADPDEPEPYLEPDPAPSKGLDSLKEVLVAKGLIKKK